ncbi:MAG: hypothetical protein MJ188_04255 [Treponema sp.]|nr:hypothetical protein [Treponema sp.]
MDLEFVERAYAKVNFNLKVLPLQKSLNSGSGCGKQESYHSIESIFQTVDLYDELIVSKIDTKDSDESYCEILCEQMQLPEKNTLSVSYKAFCEVVEKQFGTAKKVHSVRVVLKKGIPAGGGLGGGSADAAALIRVLEKMNEISLSDSQKDYIADKTGSDVFFFMHCDSEGKGAALIAGRGEKIKTIKSRKDLFLLLVFPEVRSSTKEAYALVDEYLASEENKVKYPDFEELETIYRKAPREWNFLNSFTPALCSREEYSSIKSALKNLRKTEAEYVEMSGSGSTVFGVFTFQQQAMIYSDLLAGTIKCVLTQTV